MIGSLFATLFITEWLIDTVEDWLEVYQAKPELVPRTLVGWEGVVAVAIFFAVFIGIMVWNAIPTVIEARETGNWCRAIGLI
jgi:hypothetical protein